MLLRTVIIWCVLLVMAILNGGFREAVLVPGFGRGVGHAMSTVMLSALSVLVGWIAMPWIAPRTIQDAWMVGIVWLALTLLFEFVAGRFLFGRSWIELMTDYNLLAGRIWLMVLVVTLLTPVLAFTRRSS